MSRRRSGCSIDFLERSPLHVGALALLADIRTAQSNRSASEALLKRIVRLDPNHLPATQALALLLFGKRALAEAEHHARNAVRIAPLDPQSHNLMGMIMTEAHRPQVGEHHYRRARDLLPQPSPILLANLAWNLKNQGRIEELRGLVRGVDRARSQHLSDPVRLGADGGDRPQFRPRFRIARRRRAARAGRAERLA